MKAVVQRVKKASVNVHGKTVSEIGKGLLVLLAVSHNDNDEIIRWMANKIVNLRIFSDDEGKMNKSVIDLSGAILMISNFTVYGDVHKGFRPNFMKSAPAEISEPIYQKLVEFMRNNYPLKIADGKFGEMMDIELINDGPVTVVVEKEMDELK